MTAPVTFTKGEANAKLDAEGIEGICDRVASGQTYIAIAKELGVSFASMSRWLASDSERSARAREARISAAQVWDEKAETVLEDKEVDIQRARELASHYRWRASKINPREYGDKLQVDNTHTVLNLSDEEIRRRAARIEAELAAALPPPDLAIGGE